MGSDNLIRQERGAYSSKGAGATARRRPWWRLIAIFIGIFVLGMAGIAIANYSLAPLVYNHGEIRRAAQAIANGGNVAVGNLNMDWRTLRKEQMLSLPYKPDIIIFGGSRWQEAGAALWPGKTFVNAFVSSDHYEDMMAFAKILLDADKLPKTLVLSARYATFELLGRRSFADWKTYGDDYRAMAALLDVPSHSWLETLPIQNTMSLFSLEGLQSRWRSASDSRATWRVVSESVDDRSDIVASDGALHFSRAHEKLVTEATSHADAVKHAKEDRQRRLKIDPDGVTALAALLKFLKARDVRVVLAQTPFHPDYFAAMKGSDYYNDLLAVQAEVDKIAKETGVETYGSFDAVALGCVAADFRDYHHSRESCLGKIAAQIGN